MKSVLWVCLGIALLLVTAVVTYDQGRRSAANDATAARTAALCQDALTRRRQADQSLTTPPAGDSSAVAIWMQHRADIQRQRDAAEFDRKLYC